MRKAWRILLVILFPLVLAEARTFAQDAPVYEQYVFDNTLLNPAFTGLVDMIQVKAAHRQQWIGFGPEKTPSTTFLMFRSRFKARDGGLGGFLYTDKNGVNSQTGLQVNGSFQFLMRTKRNIKTILSFGFGATVFMHTYDESRFDRDIYDPIVDYSTKNCFGYDANFGVLLTHGGLIAGVSFDNLLQWTCPAYNQRLERSLSVNMNVHAGKTFWLMSNMQLAPLVIFKTNMKNMNQMDLGVRFKLLSGKKIRTVYTKDENEVVIGLTYKQTLDVGNVSPLSISPMVGFIVKNISVSYLCEIGLTGLQRYNFGSHQIALGFRLYRDKFTTLDKHNVASMVYDF
ncbi:MAG: type IX secretion system membrane protein PorP/SprF [Bacteroidales bacterium]|nr:type IX secretion system membrane protein PorP/SprF [Bacteroidales bacterium]